MSEPNESPDTGPAIEWKEPPPKIVGRKPADRIDAVEAGRKVRARLEADRRARGVPPGGYLMDGELADAVYSYDADGKRFRDTP